MPVYKKLVLDVSKKIHDIIVAVQGDTKTRFLDITLVDGASEIDLTGCEVRIYGKKFDGTEFYNDGEITNAKVGRCQFELTSQALAVAGDLQTTIVIFKDNVEILSTPAFTIHVVKSLMSDHAIESSNEYGALVVLYQNLYEAYDLMTEMVTRIGEPGDKAISLKLDTMFEVWDYLVQYLEDNSSAGVMDLLKGINNKLDTVNNTKIGTSNNTGGSATAGTVMGKLNSLINNRTMIKSIQRGSITVADTITTVPITPVDLTKSTFTAHLYRIGPSMSGASYTLKSNSVGVIGSINYRGALFQWELVEYY